MVGTAQSNQMGVNVNGIVNKMKAGTYESCFLAAQRQQSGVCCMVGQCNCEDAVQSSRGNVFGHGEWYDVEGGGEERIEGDEAEGCDVSGTDK